ncbi:MAG: type II toxin-antitoxin system RelE/ParE family toxin [Desulfobacteraceae bacterium]|nr:type II toxin-antitoxin system RelE/ParE family toxin [Desulfobacteraceae bacterium]
MKVKFTPCARNQFLSELAYIRRDKPSAAVNFRNKAETILRRLENFPESGRIIPEFPELPYREVIVSPYRFFYKVKGNVVWIIAVWHGAQLPKEPKF